MRLARLPAAGALLVACCQAACGTGGTDTLINPSVPPHQASAPTPPAPAPQSIVSEWRGSSEVVLTETLPSCTPPFWTAGFVDNISWQLLKSESYAKDQFDLHVLQAASGEMCHLEATINGNAISAKSWDKDGLGLEGVGWCHFQLLTSNWDCTAPPEVWIDGITVTASFVDQAQNEIHGDMLIKYDHRLNGSPYSVAMIRKSFDLSMTGP
jgi:hypothetical protein